MGYKFADGEIGRYYSGVLSFVSTCTSIARGEAAWDADSAL
jgi:hypothetical protein